MFRSILPLVLAAGTAITGSQQSRAALSDMDNLKICAGAKVSVANQEDIRGKVILDHEDENHNTLQLISLLWGFTNLATVISELQPDGTIKVIKSKGDDPQKEELLYITESIKSCMAAKKHTQPKPEP